MKRFLGISSFSIFILVVLIQSGISSCKKEEITKYDTVIINKHDTTIHIEKDTFAVTAKDTVFSMDVNSWNLFSLATYSYLSPGSTTYMNTSEGIKFFAQAYRTGVRLEIKSEVGIKGKTIYYKWKANGGGLFAGFVPQMKYNPVTGDGTAPSIQGVDFSNYSTGNAFGSYILIQEDTWYYTRVRPLSGTDNYQVLTATGNYDNNGGNVISNQTLPVYTKNGYIALRIGDNYSTSAYAILGECKIASN